MVPSLGKKKKPEKHVLKILSVIFVWRFPFPAPFVSMADVDWTDPTVPCIPVHGLTHTRQRVAFWNQFSWRWNSGFQGYFLNAFLEEWTLLRKERP